jgi:hypothetical protein
MSVVQLRRLSRDKALAPERPDVLHFRGTGRQLPSRIGAARDVAWALLMLAFIGTGILMLSFLLYWARAVIGQ